MSFLVTQEVFDQAVALVRPSIDALLAELGGGRRNLHIVVIEPSFHLYETTIAVDPKESWAHKYDEIARAKAELCHRTGQSSSYIVNEAPWILEGGDARFAGGFVQDELAAAVSGLLSHLDEVISRWIWSAVAGICKDRMKEIQEDKNSPDILPISEEQADATSNDAAAS